MFIFIYMVISTFSFSFARPTNSKFMEILSILNKYDYYISYHDTAVYYYDNNL